jgi:hypothetical protein
MPLRLITSQHFTDLAQGMLWGILAVYNGAATFIAIITEADWNRITGPHGVAFISVIAVIILWSNGIMTRKAEDKRRAQEIKDANNARADLLKALEASTASNNALTSQCIHAIERNTAAVQAFDKTCQRNTVFLAEKIEQIHS